MPTKEKNYSTQRHDLIFNQIQPAVNNQRVLEALNKVPRHLFVPPELRAQSYHNRALAIGYGQTISQPLIVALMTEALDPQPGDRILEIGTGSGYQAAVLSSLVSEIYSIELIEALGKQTARLLTQLDYSNIHCKTGDGSSGWPEHAPYDGIIVTAAPDKIPQALIEQLKDGGRLVIPLGTGEQRLKLFIKRAGKLKEQDLGAVRFVPMLGDAFVKESEN